MKTAWDVAADLIDPPEDDWSPLPHQMAPPGDWFLWFLLGGRGAGKTAAAARYVHEHVYGPPCLPSVPGGHWIGIVAPTLGDAVTSCCYGPSGLRAHDSGLKVVQTAGGSSARWSNGAEAKLFGASKPEDIERFRAGGNRCIAEGSLVETLLGRVPIELVEPGSLVRTSKGDRRVLARWDNDVKKTVTLHTSKGSVSLTPDHQVKTLGGWVEAGALSPGAEIVSWPREDTAGSSFDEGGLDSAVLFAVTEGPEVRVFDLSVEGQHEFFANGLLVHNCLVWAEEIAAWRYLEEAWDQIRYGLRVGPRPHAIASSTPKNRKLIKKLIKDPTTITTKASTDTNPFLDEGVKKRLFEDYGSTRMGRQELYADILEDIEGALWTAALIDRYRVALSDTPEKMTLVKVGVDPGGRDTENSDETGIVVVGMVPRWKPPWAVSLDDRPHGFVFADYSIRGKPDVWAKRAVEAYRDYAANGIVAETNNGHDMVKFTLRTVDPTVPVTEVYASRGKVQRAEPVYSLYEQGRIHHVGVLPILEDQMTSYDIRDPDHSWSPDHLDAMVWAATDLLVTKSMMGKSTVKDSRLKGRR